jgi:hypothetical protein
VEEFLHCGYSLMYLSVLKESKLLRGYVSERIGFSRFAMIFAIILYRQLQREMGRKSLNEEGLSDFRMRAMKVDLMAGEILPLLLQSSTILSKSSPRMSKKLCRIHPLYYKTADANLPKSRTRNH